MSFGKMNDFAQIIKVSKVKDSEGFVTEKEEVIADVRVYREGRHGSSKWANLSQFTEATDLFRFRTIPRVDITTANIILCNKGRFEIFSVENVRGRSMYTEVLAKRVDSYGKS